MFTQLTSSHLNKSVKKEDYLKNNQPNAAKETLRNTNIEWLRIISMILIIAYHGMRNGFADVGQPFYIYSYTVLFGSWGILGVDLFIIISAYFLSAQQFRIKKVIHIFFQVFSWVIGYTIVYFVCRLTFDHWGVKTVVEFLCQSVYGFFQPLWSGYYWFVTSYFFMLLLSPFLNRLLEKLDQNTISKILIVFLFVPIYAQFSSGKVGDTFYFLYVYLLIGYIRLYGSSLISKFAKPRYFAILIASVVVTKIGLRYFESENVVARILKIVISNTVGSTGRNSMIILIISLLIFFWVLNKKPTYNKWVNRIASCTLGVYLFHENSYLGLPNTLNYIFSNSVSIGFLTFDMFFPFKHFAIVILVFLFGTVLEMIRDAVLQKPFMKFVAEKYSPQLEKADKWFNELGSERTPGFDRKESTGICNE